MSVSPGGEAILFRLSNRGALCAGWQGDILECYCTFNVFAGENGGFFPLHVYADVRGHGTEK